MEFDLDAPKAIHPEGRYEMKIVSAKFNDKLGKLIVEWSGPNGTVSEFLKRDNLKKVAQIHNAIGFNTTHVDTDRWIGQRAMVTVSHSICGRYANAVRYEQIEQQREPGDDAAEDLSPPDDLKF